MLILRSPSISGTHIHHSCTPHISAALTLSLCSCLVWSCPASHSLEAQRYYPESNAAHAPATKPALLTTTSRLPAKLPTQAGMLAQPLADYKGPLSAVMWCCCADKDNALLWPVRQVVAALPVRVAAAMVQCTGWQSNLVLVHPAPSLADVHIPCRTRYQQLHHQVLNLASAAYPSKAGMANVVDTFCCYH
jgi:hypothetical protein